MTGSQRWVVSFADLLLLLLGLFVVLHAQSGDAGAMAQSARAALNGARLPGAALEQAAASLFEPGEARLKPAARDQLGRIGARAGTRLVRVESRGRSGTGARFDAWELAAARAAAVARAVAQSGIAPDRVQLVLEEGDGPQHLRVTYR